MKPKALSRRTVLATGAYALAASALMPKPARARAATGQSAKTGQVIRRYYRAWEKKDWSALEALLAGGFGFSSAAGDDHIPASAFKAQCWDTQSPYIARFELLRVFAVGSEAFVMYICHTTNDKSFRNVEYFQLAGDQVEAIECYFGATAGYPTAAGAK